MVYDESAGILHTPAHLTSSDLFPGFSLEVFYFLFAFIPNKHFISSPPYFEVQWRAEGAESSFVIINIIHLDKYVKIKKPIANAQWTLNILNKKKYNLSLLKLNF